MSKTKDPWKKNWPVFLRTLITLRWKGRRPQLVLIEKYEPIVKWTLRGIALLGIISSIFIFPSPYEALAFAIGVFIVQQFFEKTVFVYTTIYVQPMPDFVIEPKQWTGIGYAFPEPPADNKPNIMGPAFATEEYAQRVFALIRSWNYDENEDKDGNICLSLILEGNGHYTVFIYPNMRRPTTEQFFAQGDALKKDEKHGREHQKLVVMLTFCKVFPLSDKSLSHRFVDECLANPDRPIWLQAFRYADGKTELLFDVKPILIWHFKIKKRAELDRNDTEYTFRNQGRKAMSLS